ncbi:MAG: hypothetical protein IJ059_02055 [Prevotella sp.]|nr:hypothetical protein [Prevotella sp.]
MGVRREVRKPVATAVKSSTFAVAMKMQRRLRAAAQHSSSELGSAFALHRNCPGKRSGAQAYV